LKYRAGGEPAPPELKQPVEQGDRLGKQVIKYSCRCGDIRLCRVILQIRTLLGSVAQMKT